MVLPVRAGSISEVVWYSRGKCYHRYWKYLYKQSAIRNDLNFRIQKRENQDLIIRESGNFTETPKFIILWKQNENFSNTIQVYKIINKGKKTLKNTQIHRWVIDIRSVRLIKLLFSLFCRLNISFFRKRTYKVDFKRPCIPDIFTLFMSDIWMSL